jgi:hypothetical protein
MFRILVVFILLFLCRNIHCPTRIFKESRVSVRVHSRIIVAYGSFMHSFKQVKIIVCKIRCYHYKNISAEESTIHTRMWLARSCIFRFYTLIHTTYSLKPRSAAKHRHQGINHCPTSQPLFPPRTGQYKHILYNGLKSFCGLFV